MRKAISEMIENLKAFFHALKLFFVSGCCYDCAIDALKQEHRLELEMIFWGVENEKELKKKKEIYRDKFPAYCRQMDERVEDELRESKAWKSLCESR